MSEITDLIIKQLETNGRGSMNSIYEERHKINTLLRETVEYKCALVGEVNYISDIDALKIAYAHYKPKAKEP
jgi:hypothetical protein